MNVIISAIATFISTMVGGLVALRFKHRLHLVMGFTAGVILGVIAFELLPEIMGMVQAQGIDPVKPMIALVAGFLLFHIFEKVLVVHHAHEDNCEVNTHPDLGVMSALALAAHSFVDGVAIGLGFQVNSVVGILVTTAVITHNFTDGINTVTFMLRHGNTAKKSFAFLIIDALAPTLGAISTLFFGVSENFLVLYLGFFAGFLLYIGASDILPEAHSRKSSLTIVMMTIIGVMLAFGLSRVL